MYAIVLCIALVASLQQPLKKQAPAIHKQNQSSTNPSINTLPVFPANSPREQTAAAPNAEQQENKPANRVERIEIAPQPPDRWFKGYVIFTAIIAALNLGTLIAIWQQRNVMAGQLNEMKEARKQTDKLIAQAEAQVVEMKNAGMQTGKLVEHGDISAAAARDSADAAKVSANVLVNSERAWLLVEVQRAPGSAVFATGTTNGIHYVSILVDIIVKNQGRSPAWIIQYFQRFELLDAIPAIPDFDKDIREGDIYSEPVSVGGDFTKRCDLMAQGQLGDKRESILYGIIRYRDMFGKERSTTYGYYVSHTGRLERMSDHPEYNKST